jgi:hypothetical protein
MLAAVVVNYEVQPLFASPVVPVGVSREDIARLLHAIVDSNGTLVRVEEAVDTILAALGTKGADHP